MLNVHVRVNDSRTGKPIAVRLRITDGGGVYRPPLGRLARFRTGPGEDVGGQVSLDGEAWAYVDGACEVPLPPGPLFIEIVKGIEYTPIRLHMTLAPGQMALRFSLERWTDERAAGWHAGDMRAFDLPPHAALLEGAAEGLAVVQLLAREHPPKENTPGAIANLLAFSGDKDALRSPECLVAVNTLNTHSVLGSVSLLNCHRPVFPLRFGSPNEPDHWSVADWCDQCHRKKGLVVWPDLTRLSEEHPQGEALAALILGKIDAFEIGPGADFEGESLQLYYRLLECGLRPTLVGGSGKDSNSIPFGAIRTYACLQPDQELDASNWIEAVRAGRTYVTSGPLLSCNVEDQGPGGKVTINPGQPVRIRAEARSAFPLDRLQVLAGNRIVVEQPACGDRGSIVIDTHVTLENSTWIAARARGERSTSGGNIALAHSNPIYAQVANQPAVVAAEATSPLLAVLERTLEWVEHSADCPTAKHRQHLREVLENARMKLRGLAR